MGSEMCIRDSLHFVLPNLSAPSFVSRVHGGRCSVDDDAPVCFTPLDADVDASVVFAAPLPRRAFDFFGGGTFKIGSWSTLSPLSPLRAIKAWMTRSVHSLQSHIG